MTTLPKFFTQSSDGLYDRHHYKLINKNGTAETFKSWEAVQMKWFQTPPQFKSHVEVLDIKIKKTGGFK